MAKVRICTCPHERSGYHATYCAAYGTTPEIGTIATDLNDCVIPTTTIPAGPAGRFKTPGSAPTSWICGRCGRSNAPFAVSCDCRPTDFGGPFGPIGDDLGCAIGDDLSWTMSDPPPGPKPTVTAPPVKIDVGATITMPAPTSWVCGRCGQSNAPHVDSCGCVPAHVGNFVPSILWPTGDDTGFIIGDDLSWSVCGIDPRQGGAD